MSNSANTTTHQPAAIVKHDVQVPASTYRIQLNKDFTLNDLRQVIGYLRELGVSTIYAAPVLESRAGSTHGYDVTDPHAIDREIGQMKQFKNLLHDIKQMGMQWIQDIVPNHMAFDFQNTRLMDVLERGPISPYYRYFDIDWDHHHPLLKGKVGAPFLGSELNECLERGEVIMSFSEKGFTIKYFDTHFPLSISALQFLTTVKQEWNVVDDYISKSRLLTSLDAWQSFKEEWVADQFASAAVPQMVNALNESKDLLQQLLDKQYYLLMHWKRSESEINYRRFFTVNELICLRMEDKNVFDDYHLVIASLVKDKLISGVRIDHIDGLYDPALYVSRLRKTLGDDCYIIAEKILEASEKLPEDWQLQGTSGYEFLAVVNQLTTDRVGAQKLTRFYQSIHPELVPYHKLIYENKKLILHSYMGGEWDNLLHEFKRLNLISSFDENSIREAIGELMLSVDVYRIYPGALPLSSEGREVLEKAFTKAFQRAPQRAAELQYLQALFFEPQPQEVGDSALKFLKRLMQFTGPLTAKGIEDTTFYVFNPLISHDEVGDAPQTLAISIATFHSRMQDRMSVSPHALNATATHDTKRGEDSRIRLNIISELAEAWEQHVNEWREINKQFLNNDTGERITPNDEYLIYQALIGGFPENLTVDESFLQRFEQFLIKALREAKVNSNWSTPNEGYERACIDFVKHILNDNDPFRRSFDPFVQMVIRYSWLCSVCQVLIKLTAPGIPDIYQGCELWDLSFVDPDNRRPVDYDLRAGYLSQIKQKEKEGMPALLSFLKSNRSIGLEKLYVIWKGLSLRRERHDLFTYGMYVPLQVAGTDMVVLSYARCFNEQWALVIVPLALAKNRMADQPYSDNPDERRFILLPENAPNNWKNVFTGEIIATSGKLHVFDALKDFPVALYISQT